MQKLSIESLAVLVVLCVASPAATIVAGEPATNNRSKTLYRLNADAQYLEGCSDPCACPISTSAIAGTFLLGPEMIGDAFNFREVTEVNWIVTRGNEQFTVTGSGGYYVSNWGEPRFHSLDLNLSIDGGPITYFFSDLHEMTTNDGSIDLSVSMNGMYCLDIVIEVDASPVTNQFTNYSVSDQSTYQHGCWDPCDCPLEAPRTLRGSFGLAALSVSNLARDFAVTQVRLIAMPDNNMHPPVILTGYGRYTVTTVQGMTTQRMTLTLFEDDSNTGAMYYDSGEVPVNAALPRISITLDMNGKVCLDTVLDIRAIPANDITNIASSNKKRNPSMNAP